MPFARIRAALPAVLLLLLTFAGPFLHLDGEGRRGDFLAVGGAGGRVDGESALHICQEGVGEGGGNGARHLSVDEAHAGGRRGVGARTQAEALERGAAKVFGLLVDHKTHGEVVAHIDRRGCLRGHLLRLGE